MWVTMNALRATLYLPSPLRLFLSPSLSLPFSLSLFSPPQPAMVGQFISLSVFLFLSCWGGCTRLESLCSEVTSLYRISWYSKGVSPAWVLPSGGQELVGVPLMFSINRSWGFTMIFFGGGGGKSWGSTDCGCPESQHWNYTAASSSLWLFTV